MKFTRKGITSLALILFLPAFGRACFQIDSHPIECSGDRLKVNFSYEGKPLSGAFISLLNKRTGSISTAMVDKQGWVSFKDLPSGKYKLVMDGPSHEPFDVEFTRSEGNINSVNILFYADYCHSISIRSGLAGFTGAS